MGIFLFIVGVILFILLVVIHELGHAIAAKRNGVEVEEFGIGFPPRAWAKKLKNGVLFTLNWLPLGGFVKLKGESDDAKGEGTYGSASLWAKTKILLAGVAMNWVTAAVLFTGLAFVGLPQVLEKQFTVANDTQVLSQKVVVAEVVKDSPASKVGLQTGDVITKIGERNIANARDLVDATKQQAGKTVAITYQRGDKTETKNVTLQSDPAKGPLGIAPGEQVLRRSTWSAPIVGVGVTAQLSWETVKGLGTSLWNLGTGIASKLSVDEQSRSAGDRALEEAGSSVAGPVRIVQTLFQTADTNGLSGVLFIIAIISLSLAVMNTLPIPALDGGRLFVTLLFRATKKPLTKEREEAIHSTGFLVLIGIIILISVLDVTKVASGS